MANHFHMIVKRAEDKTISEIVGNLKRYTARQIGRLDAGPDIQETICRARRATARESGKGSALWKPRFDSLVISSEDILRQKIEYIHNNPVRKGLVEEPWQWRYSSASAYGGREDILIPVDSEWTCIGYGGIPSGKDS